MTNYKVKKTDAEWRAQLDPMDYQVTRQAATERAFTGRFWDHFEDGAYKCICCGVKLFQSDTKFDAGCGWPSYWQSAEDGIVDVMGAKGSPWGRFTEEQMISLPPEQHARYREAFKEVLAPDVVHACAPAMTEIIFCGENS